MSTGQLRTPPAPRPEAADWGGVALLTACAVLLALLEVFLVPLRQGRALVPVAVVLAVAGNIVLPRLAYGLVQRTAAALAPVLGWLVVVIAIVAMPRPEGDVILPGGGYVAWVVYGVLLGGALAATVTVVLTCSVPVGPPRVGRRGAPGDSSG